MASVGGGGNLPHTARTQDAEMEEKQTATPPCSLQRAPVGVGWRAGSHTRPLPPRLETDGTALSLLQLCVKTRNRPCSFTFNASKILHKSCKGPNTDCNKYLPPPRPDPEPARGGKVCERHRGSAARTGAAISCVWRRRRRSCCCCSWSVPS